MSLYYAMASSLRNVSSLPWMNALIEMMVGRRLEEQYPRLTIPHGELRLQINDFPVPV